jgi:hypothetical protein
MTNILADSVSAQTTEQKPESWLTNLVKTFLFSVVVVLVCAVAWGLVGYFTNTIYFWAAIVIGLLVSLAAMSGFKRVNIGIAILMFIPCLVLTLLSIVLGDFLYYTLLGVKEAQLDWLTSMGQVAQAFIDYEISSKDGRASLLFGGIGALVGFFYAVRSN